MLSAAALVLAALVGRGLAVLVNRTIDDQLGDPITGIRPTYSPPGNWTQGATCSVCYAQPDRSMVFDGTWHDSTYFVESQIPRTITMTFNGSAIYVYFFTMPQLAGVADETYLNITLDAQPAGIFSFVPGPTDPYHYNVSVYSNSNIVNGQHTIVISTGGAASGVLEFDYAVYSIDDGTQTSSSSRPSPSSPSPQPSSSQSSVPIGAIVGSVIGGFVTISVSIFLFLRCRHRGGTFTTSHDDEKATMPDQGPVLQRNTSNDRQGAFTHDVDSSTPAVPFESENREQNFPTHGYVSTSRSLEATTPSNDLTRSNANLRQAELRRRMQDIQQEMADIERASTAQIEPIHDAGDLRANLEALRAEVELLRQAQKSTWVGLSDGQVPAYTEVESDDQ